MLRDIVANMGLEVLAIIALVIFFAVFCAIVVWVLVRPKREMDMHSQIPINDDVVEPRNGA